MIAFVQRGSGVTARAVWVSQEGPEAAIPGSRLRASRSRSARLYSRANLLQELLKLFPERKGLSDFEGNKTSVVISDANGVKEWVKLGERNGGVCTVPAGVRARGCIAGTSRAVGVVGNIL